MRVVSEDEVDDAPQARRMGLAGPATVK